MREYTANELTSRYSKTSGKDSKCQKRLYTLFKIQNFKRLQKDNLQTFQRHSMTFWKFK